MQCLVDIHGNFALFWRETEEERLGGGWEEVRLEEGLGREEGEETVVKIKKRKGMRWLERQIQGKSMNFHHRRPGSSFLNSSREAHTCQNQATLFDLHRHRTKMCKSTLGHIYIIKK